jgi:hypothetical protein
MANHEQSDVDARGILIVAGALIAGGVAIHLITWWTFAVLSAREDARPPVFPPVLSSGRLAEDRVANIPEPRLEGLGRTGPEIPHQGIAPATPAAPMPPADYGWVDKQKGIARIPIEVAMKIIVEREQAKNGPNGKAQNKPDASRRQPARDKP